MPLIDKSAALINGSPPLTYKSPPLINGGNGIIETTYANEKPLYDIPHLLP